MAYLILSPFTVVSKGRGNGILKGRRQRIQKREKGKKLTGGRWWEMSNRKIDQQESGRRGDCVGGIG